MPVSSRLQQQKVKLLHNLMPHKVKGRFKGRGVEERVGSRVKGTHGKVLSVIMQCIESQKSCFLPDFLFEDP